MKHLIVIQGPTASGKTDLAIELAKKWKSSVLSADSRQFYKEISIGTAKPSREEQKGVPHYFIGSHSIHDPISAAQFEKEALQVLNDEFEKTDKCILVGGSGLFIDALCDGLDPLPSNAEVQNQWSAFLDIHGLEKLQTELQKRDPEYAKKVDLKNPHRVLRALEILSITGKKMLEVRTASKVFRPFAIHRFVLDFPRQELYSRIDKRVLQMMDAGLLNEVESILPFKDLQSLNTVGYREFYPYFANQKDLKSCIQMVQQNSRRYAKRQLTWFRRNAENQWINSQETSKRIIEIETILSQRKLKI